jgi:hypothetical protein
MNLTFSNIAWSAGDDEKMYAFLMKQAFKNLEIVSSRLFTVNAYVKSKV